MKFLVCISNVPDTTTKITFADGKGLNATGVQFIINPYDEIALTRALELKEALGGTVTVINVGGATTEPNIRKALAIGADDAIRVNAEPTDAYFVATQIAEVIKKDKYDVILTGRESIDYNGAQVASMLSELTDLPCVTVATKLDIAGPSAGSGEATIEREIDGGKEIVTTSLPFIASAQKGMSEPRIPNMRGIMSARTKPLTVVEATGNTKNSESVKFEMPPPKQAIKLISKDNVGELVNLLHTEAKVI